MHLLRRQPHLPEPCCHHVGLRTVLLCLSAHQVAKHLQASLPVPRDPGQVPDGSDGALACLQAGHLARAQHLQPGADQGVLGIHGQRIGGAAHGNRDHNYCCIQCDQILLDEIASKVEKNSVKCVISPKSCFYLVQRPKISPKIKVTQPDSNFLASFFFVFERFRQKYFSNFIFLNCVKKFNLTPCVKTQKLGRQQGSKFRQIWSHWLHPVCPHFFVKMREKMRQPKMSTFFAFLHVSGGHVRS